MLTPEEGSAWAAYAGAEIKVNLTRGHRLGHQLTRRTKGGYGSPAGMNSMAA